ncbi:MAG TPA: hypothetical protein VGN55_18605 [Xanthobacteraceae bacterium]|jgi:hypothetical protein
MSDLNFYGGSPFKIKRPLITTNGIFSGIDTTIKAQLDELNALLGKRIVALPAAPVMGGPTNGMRPLNGQRPATATNGGAAAFLDVTTLLALPLTPKFVPAKDDAWDPGSLAAAFSNTAEPADNTGLSASTTLSDLIDATSQLSSLKYAFQNNLSSNWNNLDYNTQAVLDGYPAITDYLIAFGYFQMGLVEVNGLTNFLLSNRQGAKNVINYAIVSAARAIIDSEQLVVPDYNNDDSEIVSKIKQAGFTLSSASFNSSVRALVDDYIFNKNESDIIDNAGLGLPPELKPQLTKYIKNSPIQITSANAPFFLPVFVTQILNGSAAPGLANGQTTDQPDQEFDVQYLTDDQSMIQVSRSAVRCAAQLFYSMVLGDELDVFRAVNYFTHKFLVRGGIEIVDSRLRDDLQAYVFSNKFTDLRTNNSNERSRPAERHMFYRQVFNWGHGQVTDDLIVNAEFPKLWKVLILESAKYLERAQISPNPDSYVSRQNVMQAVEDLQYNLSTHCTGMANVITPLIYSELNFVIRRIFMHDEVLRQIVPQGGTWWRVVETLYMGMKNTRPRSTVLYNKAKLGDSILRQIADYNPSTFENDGPFASFISDVEAFITTQSILQESLAEDIRQGDDDDKPGMPRRNGDRPDAMPPPPPGASPAAQAPAGDEWAF